MTNQATTDKAALDQLYLQAYATVSLFFIQNLDAGEEKEARKGRWPNDGDNLDTTLLLSFSRRMCSLLGIRPLTTGNAIEKLRSNLKKFMVYFHPDKYHTRPPDYESPAFHWRAFFAFSSQGIFFKRIWQLAKGEDGDASEFTFPVPVSIRSFNPTASEMATPFDCAASRLFAVKLISTAPNNPHVRGSQNNIDRTTTGDRVPNRLCHRAFRNRNIALHSFGTFETNQRGASNFKFESTTPHPDNEDRHRAPPPSTEAQPDDHPEAPPQHPQEPPHQQEPPSQPPTQAPPAPPQQPAPTSEWDASHQRFRTCGQRASQEQLAEDPFAILDHLSIHQCVGSEGAHFHEIQDIPRRHHEAWAEAVGDACEELTVAINDNASETTLERRIKWVFLLPILLLRKPPSPNTVRSTTIKSALASRLSAWKRRDFASLLVSYEQDVVEANSLTEAHRERTKEHREEANLQRCFENLSKGRVGRGASSLLSKGTSNPNCPHIREQLKAKHPLRKVPIAPPTEEQLNHNRQELIKEEFLKLLRQLPNLRSPGLGGLRNEHLLALVFPAFSGASPKALAAEHNLAQLIVTGALPQYFYTCFTAVLCVPINKKAPEELEEGGIMDCRPVGIGNALRCLITKTLFQQVTQVFNHATSPMQYGCGEKAGGTKMYFNIATHMEANPSHAILSLDYSNAFNETSRQKILEALWSVPDLRPIWCFIYHILLSKSHIGLGSGHNLTDADFSSEEGVQQGAIEASFLFCLAVHFVNRLTNTSLSRSGGILTAGMDDTYMAGKTEALLAALTVEILRGRIIWPVGQIA